MIWRYPNFTPCHKIKHFLSSASRLSTNNSLRKNRKPTSPWSWLKSITCDITPLHSSIFFCYIRIILYRIFYVFVNRYRLKKAWKGFCFFFINKIYIGRMGIVNRCIFFRYVMMINGTTTTAHNGYLRHPVCTVMAIILYCTHIVDQVLEQDGYCVKTLSGVL